VERLARFPPLAALDDRGARPAERARARDLLGGVENVPAVDGLLDLEDAEDPSAGMKSLSFCSKSRGQKWRSWMITSSCPLRRPSASTTNPVETW
jgi:hypothetical protein